LALAPQGDEGFFLPAGKKAKEKRGKSKGEREKRKENREKR
jgi:hypothetical protein